MQRTELFTQAHTILLDGGMGTMLQAAGLQLGARPEELNMTDPDLVGSIHAAYAAAGSAETLHAVNKSPARNLCLRTNSPRHSEKLKNKNILYIVFIIILIF